MQKHLFNGISATASNKYPPEELFTKFFKYSEENTREEVLF